METTEQGTRNMLWIVSAAIVVALVVVGGVLYALFGQSTQQNQVATGSNTESNTASSSEIRQDIAALNASIDQLKSDQAAAKKAVDDKKIKVGS